MKYGAIQIKDHFLMTEWEQMRSFFAECYRPDHVTCHKKFFEWQFRVDGNSGEANLLCAWEGNRLVGVLGALPFSVRWGSGCKVPDAVWTLHWMVRKDAPRGLGRLLLKNLQERHSFVLTVNTSPIGGSLLKALGWSLFPRVPRYICVLDRTPCAAMLLPGTAESDLDAMAFKPLKFGDRSGISETVPNGDNYDPDWQLYPGLLFGIVRSLEYVTWRYLNHPVFRYHIVTNSVPERPVVCVFRIEKAFGYYEALVGRIVDFFYPDDQRGETEALGLMQTVLQHLKDSGCAYADFFCSNRRYSQVIIDLGGQEEPGDNQLLPVRLTPIERSIYHQNFAYYAPQGYPSPAFERMYVTRWDCPAMIPGDI